MDGVKASSGGLVLKAALFVGKFALAGGIIWWLLHKDFRKFLDCLGNASAPWLALAALLLVLQLCSCATRWRVLLISQGVRLGVFETMSLYVQGCFFSLAIPGGAVGGDLVKAGIVATRAPEGKKLEGVLSIAADRIAGMIGLFLLMVLLFLPLRGIVENLDPAMKAAFLVLIAGSAGGLLLAALFPFHDLLFKLKPVKALADKADVMSKGGVSRLLETARVYKTKWRAVLAAIAISAFVANPLQIACLYCLVAGVSGGLPDIGATTLAMLFGGTAAAIPLTPGGIGARDAVCKAGLLAGGVDAGAATAAPLLFTAILVCVSLFGGLLFAFDSFIKRGGQASVKQSEDLSEK